MFHIIKWRISIFHQHHPTDIVDIMYFNKVDKHSDQINNIIVFGDTLYSIKT